MELTFYGPSGGLARGTIVSNDCPQAIRWKGKLYQRIGHLGYQDRYVYCELIDYVEVRVTLFQRLRNFFKRRA